MTSEAPELLPCPFCGGKAEMRQYGNEHTRTRGYDTACTNKNCRFGREDRVFRYTLEWLHPRVVAAWNTRADLSPQWRPISEAPRDGAEFQAWIVRTDGYNVSFWEPRCRFNEHGAFEIYGRVDYDEEGWESWSFLTATHFMPLPEAPK